LILVIGRVRCDPENRDQLVAACRRMQEASRKEEGCIRYGFFAAVEEPDELVAVEEWVDRPALDRHFAEPHLQEFASELGRLVSERPEVAIHEIAGTSGFPPS
jgi:quinol monooxygenase YgiN